MNPYDFVHLDPEARVERKTFCPLNRYGGKGCLTGRMQGTIEALRPIFLPRPRSGTPKQFLRSDARHAAIIPGSSLKGLFRSVVENGKFNLHLLRWAGTNNHHLCEAAFKAFARAFAQAKTVTASDAIPSTKGSLSEA